MGAGNEMGALAGTLPAFIIGPDGIEIDSRQVAPPRPMAAKIDREFVI